MLGGLEILTEPDAKDSLNFIKDFIGPDYSTDLACGIFNIYPLNNILIHGIDCGAGIGRVSKSFLLKVYSKVDLVEQNPDYLETAKNTYLGELSNRVENYIPLGLQHFVPEHKRYDIIWTQWVLGHLTDGTSSLLLVVMIIE